jgi:uncharacterized membrane protein YkgB
MHKDNTLLDRLTVLVAAWNRTPTTLTRLGLIVVTLWIGALKATTYEATGIVPFVAHSPMMSWLYSEPSSYAAHMNPEGTAVSANLAWHAANRTFSAALLIGSVIVVIGILISLHWIWPKAGMVGGLLLAGMSLVTLSFLITTPEAWVPALGGPDHGFPYLAGPGRLVIKDAIMFGAALVVAVDSARCALPRLPWSPVDAATTTASQVVTPRTERS